MKGFKATAADMTCRDFQFELNTEFTHKGKIHPCQSGFHFCPTLQHVFNYYDDPDDRIFEIEANGVIEQHDDKCVTNKIKFIRELPIEEIYELCLHSLRARVMAAYHKYKLDILINDVYSDVREQVAKHGYGLDILINDPCGMVRAQVAKYGYGLDTLINDPDWTVRNLIAYQGYRLDILINDPEWIVRYEVANHGYGLDTLINDPDWRVRTIAIQHSLKP